MELDHLRFARDGHVGWLRLDRPDKLNALTPAMWRALATLGADLVDDPDLRALVVIGEGRSFSSGIDTSVFGGDRPSAEPSPGRDADVRHPDPLVAGILATQEAYTWLAAAPFPTIAAVRGHALGAGLQLALACDLRVVARGATLGLLEHRYGMLPDLGGTQYLPRVVGPARAKELIWTAATIDAETAARIGLCERLVDDPDLESEAGSLARAIAAQPPLAVRHTKRAVDASGTVPWGDGLVVEAEGQAACLRSRDFGEAMAAFAERRPPEYTGT